MDDSIARIVTTIPAAFFRNLAEQVDDAFAKALVLTRQQFAEPERSNMLGQIRHAYCEEGFRAAARDAGLEAVAPHTQPPGGRYSVVHQKEVYLIRSNIQAHCGPPRPTAFRTIWASFNEWLNPRQLDLLEETPVPSSERLCAMIVTTTHVWNADTSLPGFVGVGIPRADLSGWIVLEPIQTLLGRYHDLETKMHTPPEPSVEVKDRAVPHLRKNIGR